MQRNDEINQVLTKKEQLALVSGATSILQHQELADELRKMIDGGSEGEFHFNSAVVTRLNSLINSLGSANDSERDLIKQNFEKTINLIMKKEDKIASDTLFKFAENTLALKTVTNIQLQAFLARPNILLLLTSDQIKRLDKQATLNPSTKNFNKDLSAFTEKLTLENYADKFNEFKSFFTAEDKGENEDSLKIIYQDLVAGSELNNIKKSIIDISKTGFESLILKVLNPNTKGSDAGNIVQFAKEQNENHLKKLCLNIINDDALIFSQKYRNSPLEKTKKEKLNTFLNMLFFYKRQTPPTEKEFNVTLDEILDKSTNREEIKKGIYKSNFNFYLRTQTAHIFSIWDLNENAQDLGIEIKKYEEIYDKLTKGVNLDDAQLQLLTNISKEAKLDVNQLSFSVMTHIKSLKEDFVLAGGKSFLKDQKINTKDPSFAKLTAEAKKQALDKNSKIESIENSVAGFQDFIRFANLFNKEFTHFTQAQQLAKSIEANLRHALVEARRGNYHESIRIFGTIKGEYLPNSNEQFKVVEKQLIDNIETKLDASLLRNVFEENKGLMSLLTLHYRDQGAADKTKPPQTIDKYFLNPHYAESILKNILQKMGVIHNSDKITADILAFNQLRKEKEFNDFVSNNTSKLTNILQYYINNPQGTTTEVLPKLSAELLTWQQQYFSLIPELKKDAKKSEKLLVSNWIEQHLKSIYSTVKKIEMESKLSPSDSAGTQLAASILDASFDLTKLNDHPLTAVAQKLAEFQLQQNKILLNELSGLRKHAATNAFCNTVKDFIYKNPSYNSEELVKKIKNLKTQLDKNKKLDKLKDLPAEIQIAYNQLQSPNASPMNSRPSTPEPPKAEIKSSESSSQTIIKSIYTTTNNNNTLFNLNKTATTFQFSNITLPASLSTRRRIVDVSQGLNLKLSPDNINKLSEAWKNFIIEVKDINKVIATMQKDKYLMKVEYNHALQDKVDQFKQSLNGVIRDIHQDTFIAEMISKTKNLCQDLENPNLPSAEYLRVAEQMVQAVLAKTGTSKPFILNNVPDPYYQKAIQLVCKANNLECKVQNAKFDFPNLDSLVSDLKKMMNTTKEFKKS